MDHDRARAVTFVLTPDDAPEVVRGYVTLMPMQFILPSLGAMQGVLISNLAVHKSWRYRGYGATLLRHGLLAVDRTFTSFTPVGVVGHAPEVSLAGFYRKYGFKELANERDRMFLFMRSLRASAAAANGA